MMDFSAGAKRGVATRPVVLVLAFLVEVGAAAAAWAHHSFAMFDQHQTETISGTVRQFQWTNPHVWIQLLVPDASGKDKEWSIECTSVNFLFRRGWHNDTLKPGDKVTLSIRPLKDGQAGGSLIGVSSLNGAPLTLTPE
jgi:hypothetical protein